MRIISVSNQKGGCGKTTTAINLSSYLAIKGRRTLLIDLDPQGAATAGMGVNKKNLQKTVYNVMVQEIPFKDVILATKIQGLDIAPTNLDLSGAELELVGQIGREYALKKKLQEVSGYDFVLIDTPPSLGVLTVNALVACTDILIPVQTEYYALEGMSQLLRIVNMVTDRLGNTMNRRFLLTMFDARTNLSKEVAEQVRNHFKDEVFEVVIPRNIKLAEAPSHGQPISLYDPESAGAKAYEQLAEEVAR